MILMKYKVSVKQKNLTTKEEVLLCDQILEAEKNVHDFHFSFEEKKPYMGTVEIKGDDKGCTIYRNCENRSTLDFVLKQKTKGLIESQYGILEIGLYTRHYDQKEEMITLIYDVMHESHVVESYRLSIKIRKVV